MTVIDASVWLDLVTGRLAPDILPLPPVLVPGHFDAEVFSGLRGLARGGHLAPAEVQRRVEARARAPLLRVPVRDLLVESWPLSAAVSAYDAPYVALARREDAVLLTADAKLARGCRRAVRRDARRAGLKAAVPQPGRVRRSDNGLASVPGSASTRSRTRAAAPARRGVAHGQVRR